MQIRPIVDASQRRDLIAFLESSDTGRAGNQGDSRMQDLKLAPPGQQVSKIRYCPDAYQVTVASGATYSLWEFNLRFKSDSSTRGPSPGKPVLVGQGMRGDRAQIVFSAPREISNLIEEKCTDD